jgi:membrane protein YqaA with SNARE-associated domain
LGVLVIGFIDSLGIPLPAMDVLLIVIGVKAPDRAYFAALMAVLGSLAGNLVLFLGSRHGVRRFVTIAQGEPQRFRRWFARYGLLTVFIPAVVPLLPLPLKVFVITAGVLHISTGRFVAVILLARVLRFFLVAYLAVRLGAGAQTFLLENKWMMAGAVVGVVAVVLLLLRWKERRSVA